MDKRRWSLLLLIAVSVLLVAGFEYTNSITQPPASAKAKRKLVLWGLTTGPDTQGLQNVIHEFSRRHPDVDVQVLSMGAGGMNAQKLMTSIVGNVAPDVVNQDRFQISDWASRGAFRPLDDLINRDKADPNDPTPDKFYPAPWEEASYEGKVYGIPTGADNRVLYWNRTLFNQSASELRAAGLDPNRAPRTWSEVLAYSKILTKLNKDGSVKVAGFDPNYGNAWLYMYAFQNNASFMSADGKTCTIASPEVQEALKFMKDGYAILGGYSKAKVFESGLQGNENDPFLTGQIAMKIDGDWILNNIARYGPQTDFAAAPPPVPDDRYNHVGRFKNEKDTFITWVGGFSFAIPKGAKNVGDAWDFIKFATSAEGWMIYDKGDQQWAAYNGRMYIPRQLANRIANEEQLRVFRPASAKFAQALGMHVAMAKYGRVRPPTMVGDYLWQQHVTAMEAALYGTLSIKNALTQAQANVQRELDDWFHQDRYKIIDFSAVWKFALVLLVVPLAIFAIWFKKAKLGRIARTEALWAYAFVAPWIIGFVVFTFGPMLTSLLFSFTQYNVLNPGRFVGLKNYADLFTSDWPNMSKAFYNAGYLAIFGVPLGLLTGLAIALLLNQGVRGMRYYRTIFYIPSIVPGVASVVLWIWLLTADPHKGLVNALWSGTVQKWLGATPPAWLNDAGWSKPALIFMGLWGAGSGMLLWLAGLNGIPKTLYEAAEIDGASPKEKFFNITLPMLSSVMFFNVIIGIIGAVQVFDSVYIIHDANGPVGPGDSLLTPVYHLFDEGFSFFKMGYASSIAWVLFLLILLLTGSQFLLSKTWVHYETDK